jgi:hypothetical protein
MWVSTNFQSKAFLRQADIKVHETAVLVAISICVACILHAYAISLNQAQNTPIGVKPYVRTELCVVVPGALGRPCAWMPRTHGR